MPKPHVRLRKNQTWTPVVPKTEPEKKPEDGEKTEPEKKPEDGKTTEAANCDPDKKAKAEAVPPAIQASAVDVTAAAREAAVAAVKAERERVTAIQSICNGEFPEIEGQAISGGWTPEVTTKKVLETLRAERPSSSASIVVHAAPEGGELHRRQKIGATDELMVLRKLRNPTQNQIPDQNTGDFNRTGFTRNRPQAGHLDRDDFNRHSGSSSSLAGLTICLPVNIP